MTIAVTVGLLSGRTVALTAGLDEGISAFRHRAQTELGVGRSRLLDSSGSLLDGYKTISTANVQNGDSLTLHRSRVQICSTDNAFAAILGDGSVVTWGTADESALQCQLNNVHKSFPIAALSLPFLLMDLS